MSTARSSNFVFILYARGGQQSWEEASFLKVIAEDCTGECMGMSAWGCRSAVLLLKRVCRQAGDAPHRQNQSASCSQFPCCIGIMQQQERRCEPRPDALANSLDTCRAATRTTALVVHMASASFVVTSPPDRHGTDWLVVTHSKVK